MHYLDAELANQERRWMSSIEETGMNTGVGDERLKLIDVTMDRRNIPDRYRDAVRRLIVVDYDGVLVPEPERPGFTIPRRDTKALVQLLCSDSKNTFILMSGRDASHLNLHWALLDIVLVAEHGAQFREYSNGWSSLFQFDDTWMDGVASAMQTLPMQYDGSFVERKTHSIAWHFMPAAAPGIMNDLPQIKEALQSLPGSRRFEVFTTNGRVEIGPRGVDPGSFMARWVGGKRFDFVIAIGGGRVGESLFKVLTNEAVTISVRPAMTSTAKYCLKSQSDVVPFLRSLPGTV